ncbi:MAG: SCO family protein [Kiloniellales bacterium]|nr:SCO family protein [Kiloniellales bacterium]
MPQSALARALIVFFLGLSVLAAGVGGWLWSQRGGPAVAVTGPTSSQGTALVGGPFELVDQNGQPRSAADFRGRFMLIYFGYTYCPDICPTSLLSMTQGLDLLAETDPEAAVKVAPIFITVDPERDTVETMAAYASSFHEDLVALTGTAEQVAGAAKAYRVYYTRYDDGGGDYLMDHTSLIYLMGPDGAYLSHFGHTAQADEIAAGLRRYLGGQAGS